MDEENVLKFNYVNFGLLFIGRLSLEKDKRFIEDMFYIMSRRRQYFCSSIFNSKIEFRYAVEAIERDLISSYEAFPEILEYDDIYQPLKRLKGSLTNPRRSVLTSFIPKSFLASKQGMSK